MENLDSVYLLQVIFEAVFMSHAYSVVSKVLFFIGCFVYQLK